MFNEATYIAEVVVLQRPGGVQAPGRLRVIAVIKGQAPEIISVPLADPCGFYFSRQGERVFALLIAGQDQPYPLSHDYVVSLRRQRLGSWGAAR
jgi:hypothetical protein